MALSNHTLKMGLDPEYAAKVLAEPQPSAESARELGEALKASTRRIFAEFDNAESYGDFSRIAKKFGIRNPMEARRIILQGRLDRGQTEPAEGV